MAWVIYDNFKLGQENGAAIDLDTDALTIALLTSAYTPAAATDTLWSGISANQVSGTGYTAGGETVTGASVALLTGTVTFDIADQTWSQNAGGFSNARYVVIKRTSDGRLVAYHDLGSDRGNVAGDFTVQMSTSGVFTKT